MWNFFGYPEPYTAAMNCVTYDNINVVFSEKSFNLLSLCGNLHTCEMLLYEFMYELRYITRSTSVFLQMFEDDMRKPNYDF